MKKRRFKLTENTNVKPCPKCGNNTEFVAKSEQVCEDGCEVWIECKCGFDPHGFNEKLESVMGGVDDGNVLDAIDCWNVASLHNPKIEGEA